MTQSARWADPQTSQRFPLPSQGTIPFAREGKSWTWRWPLPDIPADHIIAPSFCAPGCAHAWTLHLEGSEWPLLPVPSVAGQRPDQKLAEQPVSTHIDCWHTHSDLSTAHLELRTEQAPDRYLASVSWRSISCSPTPPDGHRVKANLPQTLSQLAAPANLRHHVCSPTSVAMCLPDAEHDQIIAACRDVATGMYGSWALAVQAAGRHGAIAAVHLQSDWQVGLQLLERGLPFCASIRFEEKELEAAPLDRTGGHLVVVWGVDQEAVLVADPAAELRHGVLRRYPLEAFSRAWLARRGASYIIVP